MDNIQEMGLIEGIKNKENQCLVELMNYYGKLVYYVASKILNNSYESEDVKDCYNEVFTAIWFNIDCFKEEKGSFKGWLISITRYKALNIKRKNLKNDENLEYKDDIGNDENKDFEKIENLDYINEILSTLKEEDKLILIKRYLEGDSIEEISRNLGNSKDNIYTRISRSKRKLKNNISYD